MTELMKFTDAKAKIHKPESSDAEGGAAAETEILERLRNRLMNNEYCDSVEVRLAVVGELIYRCYRQLQKKTHL